MTTPPPAAAVPPTARGLPAAAVLPTAAVSSPASARPSLLQASGARIDIDGAVAMACLNVATRGDRVIVMGSVDPLISALAGTPSQPDNPLAPPVKATIAAGELRILGKDVASGAHRSVCGIALRDPPLPRRWSVRKYLSWSARLDGASVRAARSLVASVSARMSLTAMGRARLGALGKLERRVVVIAAAIVRQPAAVLVDDPFSGLDAASQRIALGALVRACTGRAAILRLPGVQLTDGSGDVLKEASDVILIRDGAVAAHTDALGLIRRGRLYELTVLGCADALRATLAQAGLDLRGGPRHFSLLLPPEMGPSIVLAAAARSRTPLTRCVPMIG